jgi:uncharacterized protein YkwD
VKDVIKTGILLLLGLVLMLVSISCGGGISQEEYDKVLMELGEAEDEIATLEADLAAAKSAGTNGVESSPEYQNLLKDYNNAVAGLDSAGAEYDTLNNEYELLQSQHQTLQSQNESNLNQINLLQTENTQLKAQLDELTPPFPEIDTAEIEQILFYMINQARTDAGLEPLQVGKNVASWARLNSEAMAYSKVHERYESYVVAYQLTFIAGGYNTAQDIANAAMIIWQSRELNYEINVLFDDATYGGIAAEKSGDVYYISFFASDYA